MRSGTIVTFAGAFDATSKKGYIVKAGTTASSCALAAAATTPFLGVLADGLGDGSSTAYPMGVQIDGVMEVTYGGTVAVGDKLTSDGNGKAIVTTTAGNYLLGIALEAGSASEVHPVLRLHGSVPA